MLPMAMQFVQNTHPAPPMSCFFVGNRSQNPGAFDLRAFLTFVSVPEHTSNSSFPLIQKLRLFIRPRSHFGLILSDDQEDH